VNEHVAVLGGLSDRDGEIMLRDALDPQQWRANSIDAQGMAEGDTAALWAGDARLRKRHPGLQHVLLMSEIANGCGESGRTGKGKPTAIVAGALHFSGPNSIVKLLEKRGYKIEQL
jgi:uncharacterized protein YbaP (TraB family)